MSAESQEERDQRFSEVLVACLEALDNRNEADLRRYLARHPEFAPELVQFLEGLEQVDRLAAPLRDFAQQTPTGDLEPTREQPTERSFGDYELLGEIGRGGMGVVYKARHKSLDRLVAVKMVRANQLGADAQRFRNEANILACLEHPHIVAIYDVGEHQGQVYFTMRLVEGGSLDRHVLFRRTHRDNRLAAQLLVVIARAVHHAHQRGILHRDLKPSNILIDGAGQPHVTDFGLAKRVAAGCGLTLSGAIVGTPGYMAPEQASGQPGAVTTAADVYGLGAILYALLTGRPPFQGETVLDTLALLRTAEPTRPSALNAKVHRDLEAICLKCLEKDPGQRYRSAEVVAEDLERWVAGKPIHAHPITWAERLWRWCRRNRALASLSAAVALLTILLPLGWTVAALLHQERNRAVKAEEESRGLLIRAQNAEREIKIRAHLANARAYRHTGQVGQRFKSLDELAAAARLDPSAELRLELRNEAIACLALPDLRPHRILTGWPLARKPMFDSRFQRYACPDAQGNVSVCRVEGDRELFRVRALTPRLEWGPIFSPDGRYLTAGYQAAGGAWHTTVQEMSRQKETARLEGLIVGFAPAGDKAWSWLSRASGEVRLHDLVSGREEKRLNVGPGWHNFAPHPDGRQLAVTQPSLVQVWDIQTAKVRSTLPALSGSITWSPDGQFLAAVSRDNRICIHDAGKGRLQAQSARLPTRVAGLRFNHGGDLLMSCGWDQTVRLWDPMTARQLLSRNGMHHQTLFSPDDRLLGYTRSGSTIEIWEVNRAVECRTLAGSNEAGGAGAMDFSADGQLLAQGGFDGVRIWDRAAQREIAFLPIGYTIPLFSPVDGSLLTCGDRGLFRWPITNLRQSRRARLQVGPAQNLGLTGRFASLCLSRDGRTLAVADPGRARGVLVDLQNKAEKVRLGAHPKATHIALSPCGRWVATGPYRTDGTARTKVWDARTGGLVQDLPADLIAGDSVVGFSSEVLVTASPEVFRFWRTGTWEPIHAIERDQGGSFPGPLACTQDGKVVAIGRSAALVQLVEPTTGKELASLAFPDPRPIHHLCFSADGHYLAAGRGNQSITVWDLQAIGRQLATLGLGD